MSSEDPLSPDSEEATCIPNTLIEALEKDGLTKHEFLICVAIIFLRGKGLNAMSIPSYRRLSEVTKVCRTSVATALKRLKKKGYIRWHSGTEDPATIRDMVSLADGPEECEWCSRNSYCLHEHHFPIPKKDGGVDVVRICGACHADYHSIERTGYLLIDEVSK